MARFMTNVLSFILNLLKQHHLQFFPLFPLILYFLFLNVFENVKFTMCVSFMTEK